MKRFFYITFMLIISFNGQSQTNPQNDFDNIMFYLSNIRENASSIRSMTNSEKVMSMLDQVLTITDSIESELQINKESESNDPAGQEYFPADSEQNQDTAIYQQDYNIDMEENGDTESEDTENEGTEGVSVSKFIPFKKKFNTIFKVEFGVNNLLENHTQQQGLLYPEINTGGSWYWNWTLMRRARIGGKNSGVAFNYGFSYLLNRYKIENDLRLTTNENQEVTFVPVVDAKQNPKLSIGYITVPLSFSIALGRNSKLELGGFAGYRVHTVQRFNLKNSKESIEEKRYARNGLNNWQYGAFASIDIKGLDLIFRYVPVSLFRDNKDYDYQTLMVGTSLSFF